MMTQTMQIVLSLLPSSVLHHLPCLNRQLLNGSCTIISILLYHAHIQCDITMQRINVGDSAVASHTFSTIAEHTHRGNIFDDLDQMEQKQKPIGRHQRCQGAHSSYASHCLLATCNDSQTGRHREVSRGHTCGTIIKVIKCAQAVTHVNWAIGIICRDIGTLGGYTLEAAGGLPCA